MEMVESKHLFKLEIGHMNSFLENHQFSRLPMALLYSLIPQKVTDRVTLLLNPKRKGPFYFCLPALLGIHRNLKQKEFFRSSEGFLRTALTGHGHPGPL